MKTPFVYFAIAAALGISLAGLFPIPLFYIFLLSAVLALGAFMSLKNRAMSHISLYAAIFFLGVLSLRASDLLPADHVSNIASEGVRKVSLKGRVADDPSTVRTFYETYKTTFTLRADSFKTGGAEQKATGLVKVSVYSKTVQDGAAFGDEVALEGIASRPGGLKNPGLFDYSKYLGFNKIYLELKVKDRGSVKVLGKAGGNRFRAMAYRFRHKVLSLLDTYFDEPYSGFLKAILIGDRSGLKRALNDDFMRTGTIHILSVSGTHVALIACVFILVFRLLKTPKKLSMALSAFSLVFYSFAAGLNPPIVRSVMMFAIFALGYILDRESDVLNSLAVAAFLILLWNPKELFDPSFQLSFGSIAAIVMLSPVFDRLFGLEAKGRLSARDKSRFYALKSVSISIAAWIGVAPIVSFYFNMTSPVAVIANLIVVPAVSLVMIMSLIFLSLAAFSGLFAAAAAVSIQFICAALFNANHIISEIPLAYFRTPAPSSYFFFGYYALLGLLILPEPIRLWRARLEGKHVVMLALVVLDIFVWQHCLMPGRKDLAITFLDVGSGDSALMEFPKKGVMLIDGGSGGDEERFDIGKSVVAPYLWNRGIKRIDAVLVTHLHEDHLGGIPYILKNFDVGCVIDSPEEIDEKTALTRDYLDTIKKRGLRRVSVREGDTIEGFYGVKIFVLNPPVEGEASDSNEQSIVLKMIYGNSSALLCGDVSGASIDHLIAYGKFLKSDIFKVPHHGGSVGGRKRAEELFNAVSAKACVVSAGSHSRPDRTVRSLLKSSNFISFETNRDGAIKAILDGKGFKIRTWEAKN